MPIMVTRADGASATMPTGEECSPSGSAETESSARPDWPPGLSPRCSTGGAAASRLPSAVRAVDGNAAGELLHDEITAAFEVLAVAGEPEARVGRLDPELVDELLDVGGRAAHATGHRGEDEPRARKPHVRE